MQWSENKRREKERALRRFVDLLCDPGNRIDPTQEEIAAELGVSRSWVQRTCYKLGLPTFPKRGAARGRNNHMWNGGERMVGGYRYLYYPSHPHATKQGYVLEHRLVMEQILGRYLDPKEVVHHRNADRQDNRPENLEVFATNGEHLRAELTGRVPNWSDHGKEVLDAVRRRKRTPRKKEADVSQNTQTSDRQTSQPDSNGLYPWQKEVQQGIEQAGQTTTALQRARRGGKSRLQK